MLAYNVVLNGIVVDGYGVGIFISAAGNTTIISSIVTNANQSVAIIPISSNSSVNIHSCTFSNSAWGILTNSNIGTYNVSNCSFYNFSACAADLIGMNVLFSN